MKQSNRFPYLSLALLAAWLIAGIVAISRLDTAPDTSFLAYTLLLFTAIISAARLFRTSALVATLISLVAYNVTFFLLRALTPEQTMILGVVNVMIIGTGVLGWLSSRQIWQLQQKLDQTDNVIQDLWIRDPVLGTTRLPYALQTLKTEVLRSQRYKSKLSLILMKISNEEEIKKEQGVAAFTEMQRQVSSMLPGLLREMDVIFGQDNLGIILPETGGEGTMIIARRIADSLARKMRIGVHIGVAEFGVDAFDDKALYHAAETALEMAVRADQSIVTYSQVQQLIGAEPEKEKE
ncbi:MAG TPA: diguanylate cyclase [Anaerolineaceae bacterium]|nr:diguanylate cyclase [Anaerolineaceae bacterium]HPN53577.1 diguanylate cyclase [Anaerolineaceae bacterium]